MRFLSRFFDSNDRELDRIQPLVDQTNELEPEFEALSDEEIRERIDVIRAEIVEAAAPEEPSEDELHHHDLERRRDLAKARRKRDNERLQAVLDDLIPEVFAAGREAMKRTMGMRQYDVQLMGAIVLHQGRIAEMRTGEGKTLIPTLAAVLNGLDRPRRPRRDGQRLPRPARRAVDGPGVPLPRAVGGRDHPRHVVPVRARLPDDRRAPDQPAPRHPARGLRRGHHLRHEQRVRLRLPARQHGRLARGPGAARALVRDRRRGRQHPHRRGADPADHLGPGRGVGRPVLHVRPARAQAPAAARGRGGGRRLLRRPQGQGGQSPTEEGIDKIEKLLGIENLYDADPRLARHFDSALKAARAVQARPRLHRRGRRDRHRRRVHRSQDARPPLERGPAPGRRGEGGPARPARAPDPGHDHVPELLPAVRQARRHDRHGDDRGRGVPQDLHPRGRGDPDPPPDDPRRLRGPRLQERDVASSTR